jgi:CHAD domain-containing protein
VRIVKVLQADPLALPLAWLEALFALPVQPRRDGAVDRRARACVREARDRVLRRLRDAGARVDDARAMHRLRLSCKRLRYVAEFYLDRLPDSWRTWPSHARDLQGALGDLHDVDVLLEKVAQRGESAQFENALRQLLQDRREQQARDLIARLREAAQGLGG